ncbi:MAG: TetR/AcrR family transcriptional regulator [Hyphomicrobiaceae bacterium]|nr:TetR/AcrR family transcriptional regulator [Hyphomicrobiaceae bacterium]
MARPREFETEDVLAKAMQFFWSQGFERASMSDLEAYTGLLRGSIYSAFGEKAEFYRQALGHYIEQEVSAAEAMLRGEASKESAAKRLSRFIQLPIEPIGPNGERKGCFLCNAAIDRAPHCEQTKAIVQQGFCRLERALEFALSEQFEKTPRKELRAMAAQLLSNYFGMRVLAKGGAPTAMLKSIKTRVLSELSIA